MSRPYSRASKLRGGLLAAGGLALAVAGLLSLGSGPSRAAGLQADPTTLSAVFARAQPGDTISLAAGDYGRFSGAAKAGLVTLVAAPGATATIEPELDGAANIRFQGLTIGATFLQGARGIQFVGNRFVGMVRVDAGRDIPDAGIVFDGNSFLDIDMCSTCFEGRLTVRGDDNAQPVGVTISNNHFGDGGESDGVQIIGGAYGVRVVGNEFDHILQGDFDAHVHPLQLYGSSHTVIVGNYFHDNDTGIMAPDGADHETIENNLFGARPGGYPWPIVLGSDVGSTVVHNTLVDGPCTFNLRCGTLRVDDGNKHEPSRDTVVRDNVITALADTGNTTLGSEDHNLIVAGGHGEQDLSGAPRYAGGEGRQAFLLTPDSPGKGSASDGLDRGILPVPSASAPPAPQVAAPTPPPSTPSLSLARPHPGSTVVSKLRVLARAHAAGGIRRVEFRLDSHRMSVDTRAPYERTRRVAKALARGGHTVSARAVAVSGQATSAAVMIVHRRRAARVDRRRAWRVTTRPVAGGTLVQAHGPARKRLAATLAPCTGATAGHAVTLRLRAGRNGVARVTHPGPGTLCVVSLRRLNG